MFFYKEFYRRLNLSLFPLSIEEKKKFFIIFILILLGVFLEIISLSSIVPVSTVLLTDQNPIINNFKEKYFINSKDLTILVLGCFLFLLVIKNLYLFLLAKYEVKFSNKVLKNLRLKIYDNYLDQSILFLSKKNSSVLLPTFANEQSSYLFR